MRVKHFITVLLAAFVVVAVIVVAKDARTTGSVSPSQSVRQIAPIQSAAVARVPVTATIPAASRPTPEVASPVDAQAEVAHRKPAASSRRTAAATASVAATAVPAPAPRVRKIVATYFHGNVRCVTCRKIEAYSREAIEDGFGDQIAAGTVEFRAVNVEEDANRHFINDYQLVTKTLIVAEEVDGAVARWEKLENVWTLVSDRAAFFTYVQGGVRQHLEAQ